MVRRTEAQTCVCLRRTSEVCSSVWHMQVWAFILKTNAPLNEICSSYKAILSLYKTWTKLNSYGLVLRHLYDLFQSFGRMDFSMAGQKPDRISIKGWEMFS